MPLLAAWTCAGHQQRVVIAAKLTGWHQLRLCPLKSALFRAPVNFAKPLVRDVHHLQVELNGITGPAPHRFRSGAGIGLHQVVAGQYLDESVRSQIGTAEPVVALKRGRKLAAKEKLFDELDHIAQLMKLCHVDVAGRFLRGPLSNRIPCVMFR
jgi:hypothetical protein